MKNCINGEKIIRLLWLLIKLLKFEIQKYYVHMTGFPMPGHICCVNVNDVSNQLKE